jgi:pimeloyl-ACP methyl ester carboxylesterase
MLSAEATDRSAATAGLALVARLVGIVEVRAARSLKQVPRGGRFVAQLTRRAGDERARGQAIVTPQAPIRREIGVADQRADAVTEPEGQEASIRKPLVADIHDGTGSGDKRQFLEEFGAIADRFEREGVRRVAEGYLRGPTRIHLVRKDAAMWRKFHADFVALSSVGLANTLRGVQLRRPTMYELEARLRGLRVPTLVIVGEEDTPALDASRFLAQTIPDATLTVLPRTGHTLNLEEPAAFNRTVLDFLRSLPR